MTIQGVAVKTVKEISVEEKLHMILEKAEQGDLEAIELVDQINALMK